MSDSINNKEELRPKHCGECIYIQFREDFFNPQIEGHTPWYCTQAKLKVYRDEDACAWGLK